MNDKTSKRVTLESVDLLKVKLVFPKQLRGEIDFAEKSVECAKLYIVVDDYPIIICI